MTAEQMHAEAAAFHGERCAGAAMGVKALLHIMEIWNIPQKDPKLRIWMGDNGCITDAIQILSGATIGNRRMKVPAGRVYRFAYDNLGLVLYPHDVSDMSPEEVLQKDVRDLFGLREEENVGSAVREAKEAAAKRPVAPDLYEKLYEKVSTSLVDGKLPCAVAYKIADEMDIFVGEVGKVADAAGYKISRCQLGCFR